MTLLAGVSLLVAFAASIPFAIGWATRARSRAIRTLNEQRYNLLESIPDGIFILDHAWRFTHINEQGEALLRQEPGTLIGRRVDELLDPLASELYPELVRVRESGVPLERLQHFQSTNRWIELRVQPARDEMLVYLRDVTERRRAQLQIEESERRLRLVLTQAPAALWTCDRSMRVTPVSGAAIDATRFSRDEAARAALIRALSGEAVTFETRDGERWMQNQVEPLRDAEGEIIGAAGVTLDVTEVRESANRFARLAREDAMTKLPNRLALNEILPPLLEKAKAEDASVAVLFIDVDRFKRINDSLGHSAGDELLRAVTERLQQMVPVNALVSRFGGDEFLIVMDGIRNDETAFALARDVLDVFADPFEVFGHSLSVSASVGAALYPRNGEDPEQLISFADEAMYQAKESGGGDVKFYDRLMHVHALERLSLEQDLRYALVRGELTLEFQPLVDLRSQRIVAAEALVRWKHPLFGELSPQSFIGIAEETRAIVDIDRWVLREACKAAVRVREALIPDFRISVNLSPLDLRDTTFPEWLSGLLQETRLPPEALDVELTENVFVQDSTAGVLAALSSLGVKICVDDFGIGYSALGYLKRLPVDQIKIDKMFVRDIVRDQHDQGIVKAMATLAKTLGLRLVAEGVETEAQFDIIRDLECNYVQGYYFFRPMAWPVLWDTLEYECAPHRRAGGRIVSLTKSR
ncbi:MAG TPA: EAL domain-containing protein [Candidatus Baltobacteraceae bacterium]|nr:EAL domain-containing protein [Candidatus Baltobacteraceae bacterium]